MVNVDKRIKPAEKQAASATVRRPRNQALNSSIQQGKKISTKGKNPFTKLNSSKLNCSVIDGKTYEEARKILTSGDDNYEYLWDYFNEYMTKLGDEIGKKVDIGLDVVADDFFNTMADTPDEGQFYEKMKALGEQYGEDLDSSLDASTDTSADTSVEDLNSSTDATTDTSAENGTDLDSGCDSEKQDVDSKLNCSEEETKIVTESGNEVSLSDIQIIQDPNTNEIALFIQEDPDEAIPEGFTVIGVASQPALPAVDDEGAVCPECGQDPCVCEGDENLDSSANPRQS